MRDARERFCPDVPRSRLRLTDLGLVWTEFDIEADPAAAAGAERLAGIRRVPTIIIRNRVLVEPSNAGLDVALVAAGIDIENED